MQKVPVDVDVRRSNNETAEANRALFEARGTRVVNLMSAPGAGKTTLLGATLSRLRPFYRVAVIEGDLQTTLDADRINELNVPALQITTGTVCHLDARMIARTLADFPDPSTDILFIENVGNLVCPAEFDLGEHLRVMVCSVVDGAEKPKKYPLMFHKAHVVLLNKIDLIPYAGVDLRALEANVREVNPHATVLRVSCRTGEGLDDWCGWLKQWTEASLMQDVGGWT